MLHPLGILAPERVVSGSEGSFAVSAIAGFSASSVIYLCADSKIFGKGIYARLNSEEAVVYVLERYREPLAFTAKKKQGRVRYDISFTDKEPTESAGALVKEIQSLNIDHYDLKGTATRIMQDDWRLLIDHYARHMQGNPWRGKTPYSKEQIEALAKRISRELADRKIVFVPESYGSAGSSLWAEITKGDPYIPHVLSEREFKFIKDNIQILLAKLNKAQLEDLGRSLALSFRYSPELNHEDVWNIHRLISNRVRLPELPGGIRSVESRFARDKCMECDKPPTVEIRWAEGMAHAWFCDVHYASWKKAGDGYHDVNAEKKVLHGIARKHWDDPSPKTLDEGTLFEIIKHEGDRWVLYSHDGTKVLGRYDTEEEAKERERQIQFFKHQQEAGMALPPLLFTRDAVCLTGSIIWAGDDAHDVDVLIRAYTPQWGITSKIAGLFAGALPVQVIVEPKGPNWDYLPVGDFWAWPRGREVTAEAIDVLGKYRVQPILLVPNWMVKQGESVLIKSTPDTGFDLKVRRLWPESALSIEYLHEGDELSDEGLEGAEAIYDFVFLPRRAEIVRSGDSEFMAIYAGLYEEAVAASITPGRAAESMKAATGYGEVSFYDPDSFWVKWGKVNVPFNLEPKYDGIRIHAHKRGDKVWLYTEDKRRDRASILPGVVKSLKEIPGDFVLDGEMLLLDENGDPVARHLMAGIVSKTEPYPESARFAYYVHDLLYQGDVAITDRPFSERHDRLVKLLTNYHDGTILTTPSWRVENEGQFRVAFKKAASYITSEGAMAKRSDSLYEVGRLVKTWCLAPETPVFAVGAERIDEVEKGTLISNVGSTVVSEVAQQEYIGTIIRIDTDSFPPILATPEHMFAVYAPEGAISWRRADSLTPADQLVFPTPDRNEPLSSEDYERRQLLEPVAYRLLGLLAASGYVENGDACFEVSSVQATKLVKFLSGLPKAGIGTAPRKKGATTVFKFHVVNGSMDLTGIPLDIVYPKVLGGSSYARMEYLRGFAMGEHVTTHKRKVLSWTMASGLLYLAFSIGIKAKISRVGDGFQINFKGDPTLEKNYSFKRADEKYLPIGIDSIKREPYAGPVYHIQTGTGTFLGPVLTHNSKIKLAMELKVQIIGIYRKPSTWKDAPSTDATGVEALRKFESLQEGSNTYIFRVAYLNDGKLIPIDADKKLAPSDLELRWDGGRKQWVGTDSPTAWKMAKGFSEREPGDYAYGNTYGLSFEKEPELGQILTMRPMGMRYFEDGEGKRRVAWMFPNIQELDLTRTKPDTEKVVDEIVDATSERQVRTKEALPFAGNHEIDPFAIAKFFTPSHVLFIDACATTGAIFLAKMRSPRTIVNVVNKDYYPAWRWLASATPGEIFKLISMNWELNQDRKAWLVTRKPIRNIDVAYKAIYPLVDKVESREDLLSRLLAISTAMKTARLSNTTLLNCLSRFDGRSALFYINLVKQEQDEKVLQAKLLSLRGRFVLVVEPGRFEAIVSSFNHSTEFSKEGAPYVVVTNFTTGYEEEVVAEYEGDSCDELVEADNEELPKDFEELPHDKQRQELEKVVGDWYMVDFKGKKPLRGALQYHARGLIHPDSVKEIKNALAEQDGQDERGKLWKHWGLFTVADMDALKRGAQEIDDKKGAKTEVEIDAFINRTVDRDAPKASSDIDWSEIYSIGNCHADLRLIDPGGEYLSSSWTNSVRKVVLQRLSDNTLIFPVRDRLLQNESEDQWLVFKKGIQPLEWLDLVTSDEPMLWRLSGTVGATQETAALFIWLADIEFVPGVQKSDFHEYALRFTKLNDEFDHLPEEKLSGRFDFKEIELSVGGKQWLGSRPWSVQVPYALTHSEEAEAAKAKRDRIKMIWNPASLPIMRALRVFPANAFDKLEENIAEPIASLTDSA